MAASKDELVPPDWLTVEFVAMALRSHQKRDLMVLDITIKPGSNAGDHFASVMFRIEATVSIEGSDQQIMSMILKTKPFVKGVKMDFLKGSPLFEVETKMYGEVLPAIKALLDTCGITPFWPTLVYQALEPTPVLIFEDLVKLGYTVPKDPYAFEPAKRIYSKLAAIHATSFYLHNANGYDFNEFKKGIFDFPAESTETMFGKHLDYFINEIATWPDYAEHQEKFKLFRRQHLEFAKKTTQCIPDGYNVLNHGDFHQKNTLAKLAEQNGTQDYILLDYQICFWTSPGLDLVYSLFMMVTTEARRRRNELVKHYHNEFCRILEQLKFDKPIPTLDDLNKEIERFGFLEVLLCTCFVPYSFVDLTKIEDLGELFGDNEKTREFTRRMYQNKDYQQLVRDEMPRFLEMGFTDLEK